MEILCFSNRTLFLTKLEIVFKCPFLYIDYIIRLKPPLNYTRFSIWLKDMFVIKHKTNLRKIYKYISSMDFLLHAHCFIVQIQFIRNSFITKHSVLFNCLFLLLILRPKVQTRIFWNGCSFSISQFGVTDSMIPLTMIAQHLYFFWPSFTRVSWHFLFLNMFKINIYNKNEFYIVLSNVSKSIYLYTVMHIFIWFISLVMAIYECTKALIFQHDYAITPGDELISD